MLPPELLRQLNVFPVLHVCIAPFDKIKAQIPPDTVVVQLFFVEMLLNGGT